MILTIATSAIAFAVYFFVVAKGPKRSDPPSAGWLPIAGSLPFLGNPMGEHLMQQHGSDPIVTVHYGVEKIYYLNSYTALKEALVTEGDKFLARPSRSFFEQLTGREGSGIILANGQQWRDYRRFSLKTLRDFGFGRQGAEEIIQAEARYLCELIDREGTKPQDTAAILSTSISNVICKLVFGRRLASEDRQFERIREIFKMIAQPEGKVSIGLLMILHVNYLNFVPFVSLLLRWLLKNRLSKQNELIEFCRTQIESHRRELQPGEEAKDYIDAHLQHQEVREGFTDIRLTMSISDLFLAGTDTTSHTLRWAILFMMENPDVAQKVFDEIKSQVGTERQVAVKDKLQLNYTMATIEEINRLAALVPLGVFHVATEDAKVCNFKIAKGSMVMYNVYAIHHDPNVFPEPHKFDPTRFLDSDGHFTPSEQVVSFGLGKRACLGEGLARMELLIFFSTLMQRFRFNLDPNETKSLADIKANVIYSIGIRALGDHKVIFTHR